MLESLLDKLSYDDPRYRELCRLVRAYIRGQVTKREFQQRFRWLTMER
jgi:hypothetical protein